jgi:hypothetical protein
LEVGSWIIWELSHDGHLAALLSGASRAEPPADAWPAWIDCAREHGVLPLVYERVRSDGWDPALLDRLQRAAAAEAVLGLARARELRLVAGALADGGVDALLIKGAHLSLSHYPSPAHRPRTDTDLLIDERERLPAARALESIGYEPLHHVTGEVAFTQRPFHRLDAAGIEHGVDLHWRVANPRVFSDRLTWAELRESRVPLPAGGPHAFGPSPPHALLLACIHRAAHHANSDRLIWLFDLRVIAEALSSAEWEEVLQTSARAGFAPVVAGALRAAAARVAAPVPEHVLHRLGVEPGDPALAPFVAGVQTPIGVLLSDWRRLSGWRERAAFLREHLFPPADYVLRKYGVRTRAALPLLYAQRLVTGAGKWLGNRKSEIGNRK